MLIKILCTILLVVGTRMASQQEGATKEIMQSNTEFALNLYTKLGSHNGDENLFFSPFSISTVMNMLYIGARNNTALQMEKVMNIGQLGDSLHSAFEKYIRLLRDSSGDYEIATANRLYAQQMEPLLSEYTTACKKNYYAEIEQVNFKQEAERIRAVINRWVEDQTKNKIRNLIPEGALTPLTVLVIVNAIYFKGDWANQFNSKITRSAPFYVNKTDTAAVDMMFKKHKFNFAQIRDLGCSVIELPYKGDHLRMIVMLPDQIDGLLALEDKITPSMLSNVRSSMRNVKVEVNFPKFKIETGFELKKILSSLGMSDVFDELKADLSGIDGSNNLYVSKVIHKAFIEVNEEGTVAAAATAAVVNKRSIEITPQFKADHPFLFYIIDNRTDAILFLGRLIKPAAQGADAPLAQKVEL